MGGEPRFFIDGTLSSADVGAEIALPDDVAHHALRVLRLDPGDAIALFDGTGGEYAATITRAGKRDAWARVERFDPVERESRIAVTLAQAVVAADAMDAIVRHAVELGVAAIQPVITERGARFPPGAHGGKRLAHWRQVAVSACEQCGRNRVPPVHEPVPLAEWLARARSGVVFDAAATDTLPMVSGMTEPAALVGPEGGLSDLELARARRAGLHAVRLGPRILRADTAALTALAAVNLLWGDFR
jgi:16S rRNA (uracil1498-N3)-methyltransferase